MMSHPPPFVLRNGDSHSMQLPNPVIVARKQTHTRIQVCLSSPRNVFAPFKNSFMLFMILQPLHQMTFVTQRHLMMRNSIQLSGTTNHHTKSENVSVKIDYIFMKITQKQNVFSTETTWYRPGACTLCCHVLVNHRATLNFGPTSREEELRVVCWIRDLCSS